MREIKFRIWDKDYKKMRRCGENTHDSMYFDEDGTVYYYNLQNGCGSLPDGTGTYDLMQYTGLKDKNGKEIYEGDILSTDLSRPFLIVEFRNGAFMYQCHDNDQDYYDLMLPTNAKNNQDNYLEVIGNMYENPDLIQVGGE
ncbi:hypothetical protein JNUCC42_16620 [Brevibacterium sp. JNUCC-42]|nr:hypothetical protein JNUCC42_16620 [Brevibacterium sp. JNUCC-42]